MSKEKINETITMISGVETDPFRRYCGHINLDDFIVVLKEERKKAKLKGYSNLSLVIQEETGVVDIFLDGDRDLYKDEIEMRERLAVFCRVKNKTSKGLTREDILKQMKTESYE